MPEHNAPGGLAKCLQHLSSHKRKPDIILNGGDSVMDAFGTPAARTRAQWKLFHQVVRDNTDIKMHSAIGNHDIWGWNNYTSGSTGNEPQFGKHWAMDELNLASPYYSFDKNGWHFIVLDSIQRGQGPSSYVARLDDKQFRWLAADLAKTPSTSPVLVLSHVPILSVSAFFRMHSEDGGTWRVPGDFMHIDARRIKDLFHKHGNVKVCLSGHEHLHGQVKYLGTNYLCNGAVCGAWWNGPLQETSPGYGLIDLFADGSFKNTYVPWGWKA